jgi:hypothetical protein
METRYVLNRNKGFYSKIYLTVQTGHVNMKSIRILTLGLPFAKAVGYGEKMIV